MNLVVFNVPGTHHKLANHMTDFGSTDAVCIVDNMLFTTGYDIDNGLGYVNGICLPLLLSTTDSTCTSTSTITVGGNLNSLVLCF